MNACTLRATEAAPTLDSSRSCATMRPATIHVPPSDSNHPAPNEPHSSPMDITPIIQSLNPAQREAVTNLNPAQLVLAGAGSGKTRVLVHRIAWLIQVEGVSPHAILAVTFTNKAAAEMRGRIEELLRIPAAGLWVGTFHGLCHRLLRRHVKDIGLMDAFQILDSEDQNRLVRRLLKNMQLDEDKWPSKQVQWYINGHKEEGRRARHIPDSHDRWEHQMRQIYLAYEEQCERNGLVDFAELLLRVHEYFRDTPAVLRHYQDRFHFVLVDEFQDTNKLQYAWLRQLTLDNQNLFAVGDDDQSIYSWRGAQVENLHRFRQDYPGHALVRLEQNYRSTSTILDAANALIDHNKDRMGKTLWTDLGIGDAISLYTAFNEQEEAHFVVERIRQWRETGQPLREAAVLYRSNAQSRQFEERLVATGVPYRVYGGLRFFDRAEIKDALAYLRLLSNRNDDTSFERVVNTPTRGVGAKTLDLLRDLARGEGLSLWKAAELLSRDAALPARTRTPLTGFLKLIDDLEGETAAMKLWERVERVVARSGLKEHYQKEKGEQGEERIENLHELVNAARQFEHDPLLDSELPLLDQFLSHAALETSVNQGEVGQDCAQLMTLHSAKGLEFDLVFMVGMEEGLFPSSQSLQEAAKLEEERRLCYVGITRARQKLYLTHAESRRLYGKESYARASRFIREIPKQYIENIRMGDKPGSKPAAKPAPAPVRSDVSLKGFRLGQRVAHARFGEGVILQCEGEGKQARVQVNFGTEGVKWLVLGYANLLPL